MIIKILKKLINFRNIFIVFVLLGVVFIATMFYFSKDLPDIQNLGKRVINENFSIYDRTGEVILYDQTQLENRQYLKFNEIPEVIKWATLAAEDDAFYSHKGVSWKSLIRATYLNIVTLGKGPGGSTITQQLARNAFLTTERSTARKIREMILSFNLERQYVKDDIFEMYLNQVPYGFNAYGVESASQLYFSKSAKDIDLKEAAYLASLLKAPTFLSPFGNNRERLEIRKNWVLDRMVEFGWAETEEVEKIKQEKTEFKTREQTILAPHFVAFVQSQLVSKYGEDLLQRGGLKIITTLDYDLQKKAEEVVKRYGQQNEERFGVDNMTLLTQDPKTGQILAMVGSRDFWNYDIDGNFNAIFGLRQPGSLFKPFAYLALFEKGYSPDTIVFDVETNFSVDENRPYIPKNYDRIFRGPVNLRNSLAQSLNIPAVKTLYLAGIDNVLELAFNFGIKTFTKGSAEYGLPLVLGGGAVTLYDMVGAYSVLSEDGVRHNQSTILKITDKDGKIIEEYQDKSKLIFNPNYIRMVNDVLSDNQARTPLFGTANNALFFGQNIDVAAKTGTSSDSRDAWIVGYTPNIVTGVWVGNNDYKPIFEGPSGGMVAAPAWNEYMKYALSKRPTEYFSKPAYTSIDKPMLNGQYINELGGTLQANTILFFVDKKDPLGPIPRNPEKDSQFLNWQEPVLAWLSSRLENFNEFYNKPLNEDVYKEKYQTKTTTTTTKGEDEKEGNITIEFLNIQPGQEINHDFEMQVKVLSEIDVYQKIVFINNNYIGELKHLRDDIFTIIIEKDILVSGNEIRVLVQDESLNILEKSIKVTRYIEPVEGSDEEPLG